ncbi:hypothetical protein [Halococcus salifodinae]|uniref:Uncharacterized protein n=1 Tax=Halococcus salifodinae DSM 8989 TaxID=1227456 RepID=M0MTD6_9EURY|nr:hypothetical protein [Halococcus salifodinae]EMA48598.1 hypothetical protein C450_19321 [Halococcus salifodinae DSM 8989]
MKLTADDYDPGFRGRSYAYIEGNPYPPPRKEMRAVLACLPAIRPPRERERLANNIVSTLHELDVDPVKFGEVMRPKSTKHVPVPTPGDAATEAMFDADYQYEYAFEGDTATIELAAQAKTVLHEPRVGWRVTADAGTVSGTSGELGSIDGNGPMLLSVGEAVRWGDDPESPIIAGARFEELPVPAAIAHKLDDHLSEMRTLTSPDADAALGSDPSAFPATVSDPVVSEAPLRESFAWDADRLIMWYDDISPESFDPSPYQFEDGMVISRLDDPQYRDRDFPDSRAGLIEMDGLERISPEAIDGSEPA